MASYDTLPVDVQAQIRAILVADSGVSAITTNVVDGLPFTQMQRGRGFPYIRVPIASLNERQLTSTKRIVPVVTTITIYTRVAANGMRLLGAIRKALNDAQSTTTAANLYKMQLINGTKREFLLEDMKPMYEYDLDVSYDWRGVA